MAKWKLDAIYDVFLLLSEFFLNTIAYVRVVSIQRVPWRAWVTLIVEVLHVLQHIIHIWWRVHAEGQRDGGYVAASQLSFDLFFVHGSFGLDVFFYIVHVLCINVRFRWIQIFQAVGNAGGCFHQPVIFQESVGS